MEDTAGRLVVVLETRWVTETDLMVAIPTRTTVLGAW